MKNKILSSVWTAGLVLSSFSSCLAYSLNVSVKAIDDMSTSVTDVLGYMQWIGFVVAIAMCIWVGVKYLTAGAGTKAEVKTTMIPMLIGAAFVALAPVIAKAIFGAFASGDGANTTTPNARPNESLLAPQ